MKRTCKTIFSLVLTLLLTVSLATSAFATSSITFKGFSAGFDFQPGSEYTESDLFDGFKNVMPGDTVTDTITFTNGTISVSFSLAEVIAKGVSSDVYRLTLSGGEANFALADADITALLGK